MAGARIVTGLSYTAATGQGGDMRASPTTTAPHPCGERNHTLDIRPPATVNFLNIRAATPSATLHFLNIRGAAA